MWDSWIHCSRSDPEARLWEACGLVGNGHHPLWVSGGLCTILWRHSRRVVRPGHQRSVTFWIPVMQYILASCSKSFSRCRLCCVISILLLINAYQYLIGSAKDPADMTVSCFYPPPVILQLSGFVHCCPMQIKSHVILFYIKRSKLWVFEQNVNLSCNSVFNIAT